ncbi:MAG: glutamate-5-semialdehyde dehydrogenase [Candidatus Melainabacteria bacterium]|nr:MAG: glutamate-5-semialdehyde dehydrogenase [Candidatus Melainabacteria bacterium]
MSVKEIAEIARKAKLASSQIAALDNEKRSSALIAYGEEIKKNQEKILAANKKDLDNAQSQSISKALLDRLKLDSSKLGSVVSGINQIAKMQDPLGKIDLARELDHGLELFRISCPIGLIGVVFESRPDALPQIASLCLKSGNAIILKGGSEAEHSNKILFDCLLKACRKSEIPTDAFALLESRSEFGELLKADEYVDLIIPRGSNELVRSIQENTNIKVLGHADGVCHIYIDSSADWDKVAPIVIDAKIQYPAACNAVETVLMHKDIAPQMVTGLCHALKQRNVEIKCDKKVKDMLPAEFDAQITDQWHTEYGDLTVAVKIVDSIDEAIEHINKFGSGHTECMLGEDRDLFEKFFTQVNSAGIYLNASTRFADGYRYGFGAEVGISTSNMHPRGPVGIEGLVTYKYKLIGNGQIVSDYVGKEARSFSHKDLTNN